MNQTPEQRIKHHYKKSIEKVKLLCEKYKESKKK
jgi:hypothetical protein